MSIYIGRAATVIALVASLSACANLRTNYVRAEPKVPSTWLESPAASMGIPVDSQWWRVFRDPQLERLVEKALAQNGDLEKTKIAQRIARLRAHYAVINPVLTSVAQYSETAPLSTPKSATRAATTGLSATYQFDPFQFLSAQQDVADLEALATEQDVIQVRQILIGGTINFYFQIAYLNGEIARARQALETDRTNLGLIKLQYQAGATSALAEAAAEQTIANDQALILDLDALRTEVRSGLSLLLEDDVLVDSELDALPDVAPPAIKPYIPVQLLERRADLRAAELRLRETLASVDQARLSFYPTIELTGSIATSGPELSKIVMNPAGTIAGLVSAPFLNFEQMRLQVGIASAQYDLAAVQFRQTIKQAVTEVANALARRERYEQKAKYLNAQLVQARRIERLDEINYRAGAIPLQIWLSDINNVRSFESAAEANQLALLQAYVTLCEALGGGI